MIATLLTLLIMALTATLLLLRWCYHAYGEIIRLRATVAYYEQTTNRTRMEVEGRLLNGGG